MSTKPRRTTVYFDLALHQALRLKAAEQNRSLPELVNEAVRLMLNEDAEDLAALDGRQGESAIPFEDFVEDLRTRGLF